MVRPASLILLVLPALVLGEPQVFNFREPQSYNYPEPSNSNPLGTGYLPPAPSDQQCNVADVTSIFYSTVVQNVPSTQVVNSINTQFITTTRFQTQVVPTTIFRTQIRTQTNYQTSVVQQTSQQVVNRVVTSTIPSPPIVRTQFITSTRVVPQVNYVTQTQVQTQVVPVQVTRTQIQTQYTPLVQFQTQNVQQTRVITVPARTVRQTRVNTIVQTSVVASTPPAQTRVVYTTLVQQQVQTQRIPSPPVLSTQVLQQTRVIPTTSVRTRVVNSVASRQVVVTRTNVVTQTRFSTLVVPQEVVTTRIQTNVVYSTVYSTRVQPFTVVTTVVRTQFNTPPPVVRTQEVVRTSVVQVPGPNRVVTSQLVQTQQRQQVIYQTQTQVNQVTVTQTVTEKCGYNYEEPAGGNPFSNIFG